MRPKTNKGIKWSGNRKLEELLDDPVNEELYGLFLKVKDSPRHIAISAENLINRYHESISSIHWKTIGTGNDNV